MNTTQPYGSFAPPALHEGPFKKRSSINLVAVASNLFFPWVAFSVVSWALSFSLRYNHPCIAFGIVFFVLMVAAVSGFLAMQFADESHRRWPNWYSHFAVAMVFSAVGGMGLGTVNYSGNMLPVYNLQIDLKTYHDVNPARTNGQQMMDMGSVTFSKDAKIDFQKALGFRNDDTTWCVAPISNGQDKMPYYDFWAVGTNCCSGTTSDFRCGAYRNTRAHSGIRLLNSDQRQNFHLAVEQAQATFGIRSVHPLFFEWVDAPEEEVSKRVGRGYQFFIAGVMVHFGLNLVFVISSIASA